MTEINELLTIRDFLRWTTSRFNEAGLYYGHGTDNAWDEATALLLHTLFLPHHPSGDILDARLTTPEKNQLITLIQRRIQERIPLPYLTHEAWFAGLGFYVDERVLIPRSSMAELIENQFQPWIDPETIHHILDLCTGSGCIAVAAANYFPDAEIDATDISEEALTVAKKNILRHHLEQQINLHQADLFNGLPQKKYDVIISNPPYVNNEEMAALPKEYHHEPALGLKAGEDGLNIVFQILKNATPYLSPQGILIVEVGNSESALIEKFPHIPFTWIEFQRGEDGVFLLTHKELMRYFG